MHPVIRVNPVSGWKGLFVNKEFTRRILGVSRDESDFILDYLNVSWPKPSTENTLTTQRIIANNHDLQVRFKWSVNNAPGIGDVAIWDNRWVPSLIDVECRPLTFARSTFHSATYDYGKSLRTGDRVVSIGEKPYFDPSATTRREALGLDPWH